MNNRNGAVPILFVVLAVVVVAGGVGYFAFMNTDAEPVPGEQQLVATSTPADDAASWTTYTNTAYGYSMEYPRGVIVDDSIDPQGACVYFQFMYDRILIRSDETQEPCAMTTGRGAYDERISGTLMVGTTSYAASGWSAETDYEELSVSVPHGGRNYSVHSWINTGEEFPQRKALIDRILSTFKFIPQASPFDVPALYPAFQWVPTSTTAIGHDIYIRSDVQDDRTVVLPGTTWVATVSRWCESSAVDAFKNYYTQNLEAQGWGEFASVDGRTFAASSGDGPYSGMRGYLKAGAGMLRGINFDWRFSYADGCSAPAYFRVFVSNVTPIAGITGGD